MRCAAIWDAFCNDDSVAYWALWAALGFSCKPVLRVFYSSEVLLPVLICTGKSVCAVTVAVGAGTWGRLIWFNWFQPQSMAFGISVPRACWYLSLFRQVKGWELMVISCPKYREHCGLLIVVFFSLLTNWNFVLNACAALLEMPCWKSAYILP